MAAWCRHQTDPCGSQDQGQHDNEALKRYLDYMNEITWDDDDSDSDGTPPNVTGQRSCQVDSNCHRSEDTQYDNADAHRKKGDDLTDSQRRAWAAFDKYMMDSSDEDLDGDGAGRGQGGAVVDQDDNPRQEWERFDAYMMDSSDDDLDSGGRQSDDDGGCFHDTGATGSGSGKDGAGDDQDDNARQELERFDAYMMDSSDDDLDSGGRQESRDDDTPARASEDEADGNHFPGGDYRSMDEDEDMHDETTTPGQSEESLDEEERRMDKEARDNVFSTLTPYYAKRKRAKKRRPRRNTPHSSADGSSGDTETKKARRDYLMSLEAVHDLQMRVGEEENVCCGMDCLNSVLTTRAIHQRRFRLYEMDQQTRRNHLVNEISSFKIIGSKRGDNIREPIINGKAICETAFYHASGISRQTYFTYKALALEEIKFIPRTRASDRRPHTVAAEELFADIVSRDGEQQPYRQMQNKEDGEDWRVRINLPLNYTKKSVTEIINDRLADLGYQAIALSTMVKLWNKNHFNVQTIDYQPFKKCDTCSDYQAMKRKMKTELDLLKIKANYDEHHFKRAESRKLFYKWRLWAMDKPRECMFMIADGMDQSTTMVPNLNSYAKALAGAFRLKCHLTAVNVQGKHLYNYWYTPHFPCDPNMTMQLILNTLQGVLDTDGSCLHTYTFNMIIV